MGVVRTRSATRRILAAALVGLMLAGAVAAMEAARTPYAPMLAEATRRGWLRAQIVSGRLAFSGRNIPGQTKENERLSIRVVDGKVGADYEITTAKETLRIQISRGSDLHVRRSPEGESGLVQVEFRQPADGPLELTVGAEEHQRAYQAASLWHLFILEPEACREHLGPLLAVFDRQWVLASSAEQVETLLLRAAGEGQMPDPHRWAATRKGRQDSRGERNARMGISYTPRGV